MQLRLLFLFFEMFSLQEVTHSCEYQLFSLCVFVAGRRHGCHRRLSVRTLQSGGHPVEERSQRSRPAQCESTHLMASGVHFHFPSVPLFVRNMMVGCTQCPDSWNPASRVSADCWVRRDWHLAGLVCLFRQGKTTWLHKHTLKRQYSTQDFGINTPFFCLVRSFSVQRIIRCFFYVSGRCHLPVSRRPGGSCDCDSSAAFERCQG